MWSKIPNSRQIHKLDDLLDASETRKNHHTPTIPFELVRDITSMHVFHKTLPKHFDSHRVQLLCHTLDLAPQIVSTNP
jgi:hypothetical protein